jgi:hypothetical protein
LKFDMYLLEAAFVCFGLSANLGFPMFPLQPFSFIQFSLVSSYAASSDAFSSLSTRFVAESS